MVSYDFFLGDTAAGSLGWHSSWFAQGDGRILEHISRDTLHRQHRIRAACHSLVHSFTPTRSKCVPLAWAWQRGWGDGSAVREIILQTWAPEFNSQKSHTTFWIWWFVLVIPYSGERHWRIPGALWPASLAESCTRCPCLKNQWWRKTNWAGLLHVCLNTHRKHTNQIHNVNKSIFVFFC